MSVSNVIKKYKFDGEKERKWSFLLSLFFAQKK